MTPSSPDRNQYCLALLGLTLTALFWAGNALVARHIVGVIPPLSLSFWRWFIPTLLLLPFTVKFIKLYWSVITQNWKRVLVLALLSISSYNTILYMAAQTTTAINITLVSTSLPVGTLLFSMLVLKTAPLKVQIIGAATSLSGALIILSRGDWSVFSAMKFHQGDLLMLGAVLCWSLYSVLIKHWRIDIPAFPLLCVLISLGTPFIAPLYLVEWYSVGGFSLTPENLMVLIYIGIFPSLLAYLFWNYGIRIVGPATASIFSYLIPVFTTVLSVPLLGESPTLYHLAGGALTLTGLILATLPGSQWGKLKASRE